MRVLPCGEHALLVEVDDLAQARALAASLRRQPIDGVREIVPAARTVLLLTDGPLAAIARAVRERDLACAPEATGERIEIAVRYGGPDLAEVGELTGLGADGVVAAHTGQAWTVAFCGFLPGFGYLVGTDERLRVPRRRTPRTTVPAGAVGLADEFSGAYPRSSPGGWQLIGSTDATLWDAEHDPPALLRPGVRVRFVEAGP